MQMGTVALFPRFSSCILGSVALSAEIITVSCLMISQLLPLADITAGAERAER